KQWIQQEGYEVEDVGTHSEESTDYPDYAKQVASRVSSGAAVRGILMCGTGLGMSYTANRFDNVRAALAWSPEIAKLSRNHNDSNVLVLPARFVSEDDARAIAEAWLESSFEAGRHARRVAKIERNWKDEE
ncbi:MAG: ribose 5-phosphate isomerase B, partial [Gemmatimonadales bacterium]